MKHYLRTCGVPAIVIGLSLIAASAQNRKSLAPVDAAAERLDFFTFRANLQAAVARRDIAAVLDVVHPQIKSSFGGDDGIEGFKQMWRIGESDSKLWQELGEVLALGGTFNENKDEFWAPYIYSRWPEDADSFESVAVIGSNVRVRSAPRLDAVPIAKVSYEVLSLASNSPDRDWTAVKVNGRKGYIASKFVRSPVDYRAGFSYAGGRWCLTFFAAGD